MASEGLALAYRRYSLDYIDEEAEAQAARHGIWGSEFVKPWEWRRGKRLVANDNAPDQCRIKGNINRKGERIYHMPGGQWYDQTKIDPTKIAEDFVSKPICHHVKFNLDDGLSVYGYCLNLDHLL